MLTNAGVAAPDAISIPIVGGLHTGRLVHSSVKRKVNYLPRTRVSVRPRTTISRAGGVDQRNARCRRHTLAAAGSRSPQYLHQLIEAERG